MSFENRKEHRMLETWQVMKLQERDHVSLVLLVLSVSLVRVVKEKGVCIKPFLVCGSLCLVRAIQVGTQVPKTASVVAACPGEPSGKNSCCDTLSRHRHREPECPSHGSGHFSLFYRIDVVF